MEVWNNYLRVLSANNTISENVTADQEKTIDHQPTTDINRNPTHLLSPCFKLGDLGDRESLNGQSENQNVRERIITPSSCSDYTKDVDDLYTSER